MNTQKGVKLVALAVAAAVASMFAAAPPSYAQPSDAWNLARNHSPASTTCFWSQSGPGVRAQCVTLADILLGTVTTTDRRLTQHVLVGDPATGCGACNLGTTDDTAVFNAAITYATTSLAHGAAVEMPVGDYNVCGVKLKSYVSLGGQPGWSTRLVETPGCATAAVILDNSSVQRYELHDVWIEGNKAFSNGAGVIFDNDGGTFTSNDPWGAIYNVKVTNTKLSAFIFKTRGLNIHGNLEAYNSNVDGFQFLNGSTVSASDVTADSLHADANARYGIYNESAEDAFGIIKLGENGTAGFYCAASCNWNSAAVILIDNTGYPAFSSGTPLQILGNDNTFGNILITRGVGSAVVFGSAAKRNTVIGTVTPVAGGGTLTYAVSAPASSTGNVINLTANLSGSPAMTGAVDPSSDLAANFITVNGFDYNTTFLSRSTNGSAAKWTTARSLAGNSVDGSANVAFANKFIVQGTSDSGLSAAQFLGSLSTGIVKNTTTTGVLSIAVAGDFPTLNQNTSGTAADLSATLSVAHGGTNLTAAADDNVMVGNGTTWQTKSVPDCTDTAGNHLNYTQSSNTFSCGTSLPTTVTSGTFSTTCTAITNVAAVVNRTGQWLRIGNTVTVSGACDIDPTTASIRTVFSIALPVASNMTVLGDLGGAGGATTGTVIMNDMIKPDFSTDVAIVEFTADAGAASQTHHWQFTYQVK